MARPAQPVPQRPAAQASQQLVRRSQAPAPQKAAGHDSLLRCLVRLSFEFGKPLSEGEVRNLVPLSRGIMGLEEFLRAADRLKYRTKRERRLAALREIPAPFVLIGKKGAPARLALGHRDGGLMLYDGGTGNVLHLPYDKAAAVSQEVILVKPALVSDAGPVAAESGWRALATKRVRGVLRELLMASFVINVLALATPLFSMTIYNKVIGQAALDTLTILAIGMVVIYVFEGVLRVIRGYIAAHTGARLDSMIGGEVMHRFLHLPYRSFEATSTGLMAERIRQLDTIRAFFTSQMPMVIVDLAFTALALLVLFFIHPMMALVVTLSSPVMIGIAMLFHHRHKALIEQTFQAQAAKASAIAETVNNALTIKSLALEPDMEQRWESRLANSAWTSYRAGHLSNIAATIGMLFQNFASLAILAVGAVLVIDGEMSLGALIASSMLATRVLTPLRMVATAWHQLQETKAAFKRIDAIMDQQPETPPGTASPMGELGGAITFENVGFGFLPEAPPTLREVDLTVERGSVLGIIGPSGSGKSTLAKLMQGLYKPTSGRVLIDGTDVQHMSLQSLRTQIGVVPQDRQIFAGTVRENIMLGSGHHDPERAVAVAKFVGAHEFIQRLVKGYETPIGEGGNGLSNGQKQLICICRALVRNPRILIMDEPTSDLDPVAEDYFLRNLQRASKGRTIIIITHRLAPLSIADRAALVIDGRVERVGPPTEVMAFAKTRMAEVSVGRQ